MNNFQPAKLYQNGFTDNCRWQDFVSRDGDILICTPSKSGTTWMQAMVAHLIFGPDLPQPVNEMSPWLDLDRAQIEEVRAKLNAQTHRRFIKTHTPLDGLPDFKNVTYIHVARNPLDVMFSLINHMDNMKEDLPDRDNVEDIDRMFDRWVNSSVEDWAREAGLSIGYLFHHVRTFFDKRAAPNIHLFHYASMKRDTEGQMRRLAKALSIEVPEDSWPQILEGVSMENMKRRASEFAPDGSSDMWKDTSRFFDKGREGEAKDRLTSDQLARYHAKAAQLATPDLLHWIEEGRYL